MMLVVASLLLGYSSCSKTDNKRGTSSVTVRMKDAPAAYDKVEVEVTGVQINGDVSGWVSFPVTATTYDLLTLQGDTSVVLGTTSFANEHISQVRLILGSNNNIVVGGISYPLALSSQDETGLKVNVNQTLAANTDYVLMIDFDAAKSIVEQGNGIFRLKPTVKGDFIIQ